MSIFQFFFRVLGVFMVLILVFINTGEGKAYLIEQGIPLQNGVIREITGLDLDPTLNAQEQLSDQRPIYSIFDLPSFFFMVFLLLAYSFFSFQTYEFGFLFRQVLSSTSSMKRSLDNLIKQMKNLSENYYSSGGDSIRSSIKEPIPDIWNLVIKQVELKIPFEDILQILGNDAALVRKNYDRHIKIVANLSNLAPSFGVMGTVMGLMNVLGNLSDPANLGPSMALALLTTFYGLFLSVIVFKPFLTRLENKKAIEMNGYQAASFWLNNLSYSKPSFYLDQFVQKADNL